MSYKLPYPLHLIADGLFFLYKYKKIHEITKSERVLDIMHILYHSQSIPYCLAKINDNYLPLNRKYKPLGWCNGEWAVYEEQTHLFLKSKLINKDLDTEEGPKGWIYLHTDPTSPYNPKNVEKYIERVFLCFNKTGLEPYVKSLVSSSERCINKSIRFMDLGDLFEEGEQLEIEIALKEIGPIKPWFDNDTKSWVFSHKLYPVSCDGDSAEDVIKRYPLYLKEFIEHRMRGQLSEEVEKRTIGKGGS